MSRLPQQPGERIERQKPVEFTFDGKRSRPTRATRSARRCTPPAGELLAQLQVPPPARPDVLRRAVPELHRRGRRRARRPRLHRAGARGDEGRAHRTRRRASSSTSMRATDLVGGPFTPPGFYYKTFIRPRKLWPVYEKVLRHAAGLGRAAQDAGRARVAHRVPPPPRRRAGGRRRGRRPDARRAPPPSSAPTSCWSTRAPSPAARCSPRAATSARAALAAEAPRRGRRGARPRARRSATSTGWSRCGRATRCTRSARSAHVVRDRHDRAAAGVRRQRPARRDAVRRRPAPGRAVRGRARAARAVVATTSTAAWRPALALQRGGRRDRRGRRPAHRRPARPPRGCSELGVEVLAGAHGRRGDRAARRVTRAVRRPRRRRAAAPRRRARRSSATCSCVSGGAIPATLAAAPGRRAAPPTTRRPARFAARRSSPDGRARRRRRSPATRTPTPPSAPASSPAWTAAHALGRGDDGVARRAPTSARERLDELPAPPTVAVAARPSRARSAASASRASDEDVTVKDIKLTHRRGLRLDRALQALHDRDDGPVAGPHVPAARRSG